MEPSLRKNLEGGGTRATLIGQWAAVPGVLGMARALERLLWSSHGRVVLYFLYFLERVSVLDGGVGGMCYETTSMFWLGPCVARM